MLQTRRIAYSEGNTPLEGHFVFDSTQKLPLPGVLVVHDWSGRNDFACQKAMQLAEAGYAGFAIDMYGRGKTGQTTEEKSALMKPLMANRSLLLQRMKSALSVICTQPEVNSKKVAVIGFCFGGLCALDLARSGAGIAGAVSLHGLLTPPPLQQASSLQSKILVLQGFDDPMVTPEQLLAFEREMTAANADWQTLVLGGTKHAFTNPLASDEILGTIYHARSAQRAWRATRHFLEEIFQGVLTP